MRQRLFLLTVLMLTMSVARAQVAEQDSLALVALYNATDGPNWSDNTNWLTGPVPTWEGITVSGNRVVEVSLSINELNGTIPGEIGDLTGLVNLYLLGNDLSGAIPAEIGNLTNLQDLFLDSNDLSGAIPAEIGNLASIDLLSLSSNQLSGTIPVEIGNLTSVRSLVLGNNELDGTIPPEIGNLTNLTHLLLNSNELSGAIPAEIGNLINLEQFSLSGNQLSGPIPGEIGNLTSLRFLHFRSNQLSGPIPGEIGNLASLETLGLSDNEFSGAIPEEIGNLASLTRMDINNCQLSGTIPSTIGNLANLENLFLAGNQLSGSIPEEIGNLASLEDLSLITNQLSGTIPSTIGNLANLEELALYNNQLSGAIPFEIGDLANLRFLYIDRNQFSGPLPQSLVFLSALEAFWFNSTALCEPANQAFQTWLQGIPDVRSTNTTCTRSFTLTLKRVFRSGRGIKKAVIRWPSADVATNKIDFYVDESPDGSPWKRTRNDKKVKLKLPDPPFPGDGPFIIQACEKNSTTICSNVLMADFTGALVDPNEPDTDDPADDGAFSKRAEESMPDMFALEGNYPNPFNPQTTIRYGLPESASVRLVVYDALGRRVQVLVDGRQPSGWHEVVFDARSLSGGVYFYHLEAGAFRKMGQMVLIK